MDSYGRGQKQKFISHQSRWPDVVHLALTLLPSRRYAMNQVIYIIGLIVVVMLILTFLGLR